MPHHLTLRSSLRRPESVKFKTLLRLSMPWNANLDPATPAYGIAADEARYVRVVAGPGTGKSFALKRRVARLLEAGTDPRRILPVTFTTVAAEDLQREMMQIGVPGCEQMRGSTLHALGMKMLCRKNVLEATGRIARPLNRFEVEPFLHDLKGTFGNKRQIEKRIRAYEAAWARLQQEEPGYAQDQADLDFERELIGWLRFLEGMLVGEIIPQLYQYLRNNPGAPELAFYSHILVDEYQDLNKAEQAVIDLLAQSAHLCIVGDDDQSLYSFKFAHPAGIRSFADSHTGSTDHEVLVCRRCPVRVVEIANSLIRNNRDRDDRSLTPLPANGQGIVDIVQYQSLDREAQGIADFIVARLNSGIYQPGEILVLAQRRVIGNKIHDALVARDVPSKSYYKEHELDSITAQERIAIFKLLLDRQDRIALRWLLGYGSNDFRKGAYARIRRYSEDSGLSPWDLMEQLDAAEITIPYTGGLIQRFKEIKQQIGELEGIESPVELVDRWLGPETDDTKSLRDLVISFLPDVTTPKELFTKLIETISTPEIPPDVTEVRIMSLHKSKGLSSPVVVIAGCVEGLLPAEPDSDMSQAERAASLEEQRRLFYVGITRVKADVARQQPGQLLLTNSRTMTLADAMGSGVKAASISYGTANLIASRFINELGRTAPRPISG